MSSQAPAAAASAARQPRDPRRWFYGPLDLLLAIVYALAILLVIPNRLPSAAIHLWSFPIVATVLGIATLIGGKRGWQVAVIAGSAMLASVFLLIVRIAISAAFLAGVYGAFGKAAATFALVMIALIVEIVALLPLAQVKYLMSREGRRAYGVAMPPSKR